MARGYLPKKVVYVCREEDEESVYDEDDELNIVIASYKVVPTFPVEEGKKLDTAIKWTGLPKPVQDILDNSPLNNVRVINLETRGEGGRAYKVLINDKYYVDMREDVILDTMINCGIEKGALLKGEYVWGKYGNSLKLLRVGSSLHKEFEKGVDVSIMPYIDSKDVVVGGMYETKGGQIELYLGSFQTYEMKYTWGGSVQRYRDHRLVKIRVHAVLDIRIYNYESPIDYSNIKIEDLFIRPSGEDLEYYCYDLKASKSKYIKKIAQLDLSSIDIPSKIRNSATAEKDQNYCTKENLNTTHLCIGLFGPEVHPLVAKFNLPIDKK